VSGFSRTWSGNQLRVATKLTKATKSTKKTFLLSCSFAAFVLRRCGNHHVHVEESREKGVFFVAFVRFVFFVVACAAFAR